MIGQHRTLGLLDSGVGGLSVLREVHRQLPWVDVHYIGDTANVPYGDKPIPVLRDLAIRLSAQLIRDGVSTVVMASGTSTVAGLEPARELFPNTPIFGVIEPGARAAAQCTRGPIGVLATNATAHSLAFTEAIHQIDPARSVLEIGCPKFVPLVEEGYTDCTLAVDACLEYMEPLLMAGVDAVILGCTHFPFLLPALNRALDIAGIKRPPAFIDPAVETVSEVVRLWNSSVSSAWKESTYPSNAHGTTFFYATGDPELFAFHASKLLGSTITGVSKLELMSCR